MRYLDNPKLNTTLACEVNYKEGSAELTTTKKKPKERQNVDTRLTRTLLQNVS